VVEEHRVDQEGRFADVFVVGNRLQSLGRIDDGLTQFLSRLSREITINYP
jgi:hypothetical protein